MEIVKEAKQVVTAVNRLAHERDGLLICPVNKPGEGISLAKEILYKTVDRKTSLFLSGGSTPRPLYEQIAKEEILEPGVVGLVDERFGEPYHDTSNEKMILQSGLIRYLSARDIQYYSILRGLPLIQTAERYDELIRSLQTVYAKSVGILGIGKDGHTSSIAPKRADFTNPMFEKTHTMDMVSYLNDTTGPYKERVGMTFLGLSMLDLLVVIVFGEEKERVLQNMFDAGREEELPIRFFVRKDIAPKTLLITDCHSI